MKFCYLDETGTGQDTVVIVVGIVTDAIRMHRTKREWNELLTQLSGIAGKQIDELHMTDLYPGNGVWRGVKGGERTKIVDSVLDWLADRKHRITFSAVDKQAFADRKDHAICSELKDEWHVAAFHAVLSVQKANQQKKNNKGHTVLVFDKGKDKRLPIMLSAPPAWSDSYYSRGKKQDQLDQIVDVPFFADSKQVALIQIADMIGYILRRYADIKDYEAPERYKNEQNTIDGWVVKISDLLYPISTRYMKRGRCSTADLFYELAPVSLRLLDG